MSTKMTIYNLEKYCVFFATSQKLENVTTKSLTPYPTWARPPSSTLSQGTKTQTEGPQWGLTLGELDLVIFIMIPSGYVT